MDDYMPPNDDSSGSDSDDVPLSRINKFREECDDLRNQIQIMRCQVRRTEALSSKEMNNKGKIILSLSNLGRTIFDLTIIYIPNRFLQTAIFSIVYLPLPPLYLPLPPLSPGWKTKNNVHITPRYKMRFIAVGFKRFG